MASEKARIVNETYQPGTSVSAVARRHGIAPNQLFQRLAAQGALSPSVRRGGSAGDDVSAASAARIISAYTA